MNKKTILLIALFALAALLSGGYYLLAGGPAATASVYVDGELYDTFDLNAAVIPYEVTVETAYGYNVIRVSHGAVEVAEADCDGQDCVRQGSISDGLIPIVCLPHHLVIQIDGP